MLHFGIRKHELYVYQNRPEPFIVIFSECRARDLVFVAGRLVDGPVELSLHSWDVDQFGTRDRIPYHVRLCIEGIPHHAWCREMAEKVLCDEALIHHVEESSMDRNDQRFFNCWVFTKDPSRIPQTVFLSLLFYEVDPWKHDLVNFSRPRSVKQSHVFRVLIHIDAIEDLLFYRYLREDLVEDGKVPWKDFAWRPGHADGELEEDDLLPPTRNCGSELVPQRHHWDDDNEGSGDRGRHRPRGFMSRVSHWMDGRGKNKEPWVDRGRSRSWFRGESSRRRCKDGMNDASVPPSRASPDPDERRALRQLWQHKGSPVGESDKAAEQLHSVHSGMEGNEISEFSDAIVITLTQNLQKIILVAIW
jgi:hypothetical protein